ncbi:MAG: FAD binding domain-containing protein [Betaproteobacteria bacterium]
MKAFAYVNPASEKEVAASLGPDRTKVMLLAGGQDLLARMKDYIAQPDQVVNIKNALDATIAPTPDGGLKIGAAVRIADLAEHAQVRTLYPALVEAAGEVGTPQIRHQGTVGGNINQRPRCWYFRNEEFVCFKKGGNRCFAPAGENQFHAIFGNGPSHIVHPSSLAVPAVAYGAKFRLLGPKGERVVDSGEYFTMPTKENVLTENILAPDEVFTHMILPAPGNVKHGHYEVRYKQSHDWPIAFATVVLAMNGSRVGSARVVMGAVAPVPWRAHAAEQALVGKTLDESTAAAVADAALEGARPMSHNGYKVRVAKTAVKRAVLRAAGIRTV